MAYLKGLQLRPADPSDAAAIAALHAESWRRHYRGAYSNAFLDGDVIPDRLAVWADRLRDPDPLRLTIVTEDRGGVVGFAHAAFDDDSTWGALLDNLHVAHGHQGRGIGSQLLAFIAQAVIERRTGLYLWVQEQNVVAQAFYEARGGKCVGRAAISPPGGVASRLHGTPAKLRYTWSIQKLAREIRSP